MSEQRENDENGNGTKRSAHFVRSFFAHHFTSLFYCEEVVCFVLFILSKSCFHSIPLYFDRIKEQRTQHYISMVFFRAVSFGWWNEVGRNGERRSEENQRTNDERNACLCFTSLHSFPLIPPSTNSMPAAV